MYRDAVRHLAEELRREARQLKTWEDNVRVLEENEYGIEPGTSASERMEQVRRHMCLAVDQLKVAELKLEKLLEPLPPPVATPRYMGPLPKTKGQ